MDALERQIQNELKKLDPDLFLDKLRSPMGFIYYAVRYSIGSGAEPLNSVEWRDEFGPWPLSMKIVDKVKSQEGDIREAITQVKVNNAALKELARQKRAQEQEDVAKEFHHRAKRTYYDLGSFPDRARGQG